LTTHLRVNAGGHELLLPSPSVRRVSDGGPSSCERPALDLARLLGGAPGDVVILYGEGDAEILLAVAEVKGLVAVREEMLARLPPLSPRFGQLFDSIAIEPIDGRYLLCLRTKLDPEVTALEGA
jgi:hypothetical protein